MKRIRMMLMALIAVFAMGAVGASAATAAGEGELTINTSLAGPKTCAFTFDNSAWYGDPSPTAWSTDISNVQAAADCDVPCLSGSAKVTKRSDGSASFTGRFTVCVDHPLAGSISCTYNGTASGTWAWVGGRKAFNFTTGTISYAGSSSVWCPGAALGGSVSFGGLTATVDP